MREERNVPVCRPDAIAISYTLLRHLGLMLDELSAATPERLWIDAFDNVEGVVHLSGMGVNEEVVATFLQQLESSPYYMNVELQSLEQATVQGNKLQKFKVVSREESPSVKNVGNDKATEKKSDSTKKS